MRNALAALRQGRALRRPALVPGIAAAACACLLGVAAPWYAHAADEDTSSQVYLVFDPETGEFVTSHDPNAALPTQTGLESSGTPASHSATDNGTDDGTGAGKPMLIAVAAAVVVVAGAGFAFLRSRRRLT